MQGTLPAQQPRPHRCPSAALRSQACPARAQRPWKRHLQMCQQRLQQQLGWRLSVPTGLCCCAGT